MQQNCHGISLEASLAPRELAWFKTRLGFPGVQGVLQQGYAPLQGLVRGANSVTRNQEKSGNWEQSQGMSHPRHLEPLPSWKENKAERGDKTSPCTEGVEGWAPSGQASKKGGCQVTNGRPEGCRSVGPRPLLFLPSLPPFSSVPSSLSSVNPRLSSPTSFVFLLPHLLPHRSLLCLHDHLLPWTSLQKDHA